MKLFVDTSALIALEDRSDRCHPHARRFYERLTGADRLWTSNYVVDETITRLRHTLGHGAAVQFADTILASRLFKILYVDSAVQKAAVGALKKHKDKKLSFTDCATLAIAELQRLDGVFAFDQDFEAVGLRVFPEGRGEGGHAG